MDIILQGVKPLLDMPYFGRQSRFYPFFEAVVKHYFPKRCINYAETNAGSVSNAFQFAVKGHKVWVNDLSFYSHYIALSVNARVKESIAKNTMDKTAELAALVDLGGYNVSDFQKVMGWPDFQKVKSKYLKNLQDCRDLNVTFRDITRGDLFAFLNALPQVDVIFMDFAWPWRDGEGTEEYKSSVDHLSKHLEPSHEVVFTPWTKENVIENVIKAVNVAKLHSRYVFLSNQSSNYPDPDNLEVALLENGLKFERHTMTTKAENEDDLGKSKDYLHGYFREYVYVIEGWSFEACRNHRKYRESCLCHRCKNMDARDNSDEEFCKKKKDFAPETCELFDEKPHCNPELFENA